jgi:hypothetical protein
VTCTWVSGTMSISMAQKHPGQHGSLVGQKTESENQCLINLDYLSEAI